LRILLQVKLVITPIICKILAEFECLYIYKTRMCKIYYLIFKNGCCAGKKLNVLKLHFRMWHKLEWKAKSFQPTGQHMRTCSSSLLKFYQNNQVRTTVNLNQCQTMGGPDPGLYCIGTRNILPSPAEGQRENLKTKTISWN